jgi:hypothetical protein
MGQRRLVQMERATRTAVVLLFAAASVPASVAAQSPTRTTTLSLVLGPGLALERWPGQNPLVPRESTSGLSVTGRLAVPLDFSANLIGTASIWRGGGRQLQLYAVGVEARFGEVHSFLFGLGPALLRQPYQKVVVFYPDGSSPPPSDSSFATRPGLHAWTGYTIPLSGSWQIGVHAGWAYPFNGLRRFHQLSLGVLVGAGLR